MLETVGKLDNFSSEINIFLSLTLLSLIPIFLVSMTTFTRNIIVFSFLRHALGLQQSPPNIIIIVLSLVITYFTMHPVLKASYSEGIQPYMEEQIGVSEALEKTWSPLREFLALQSAEKDIAFVYKMAKVDRPQNIADVEAHFLIPAFMLSELKLAFKIGFVIFLPFLLVDLVIAAMLTALGMIMVPPIVISLPIKVMLFVVIDGWELITRVLIESAAV